MQRSLNFQNALNTMEYSNYSYILSTVKYFFGYTTSILLIGKRSGEVEFSMLCNAIYTLFILPDYRERPPLVEYTIINNTGFIQHIVLSYNKEYDDAMVILP
jgi:hypothetical protein